MMLITTKNRFPFVGEVNPDLGTYVTLKVIERIFIEIAQEELKIRSTITARTSPLLQKVLVYGDKNKS